MFREQIIKDKRTWNKVIEGFTLKDVYFTYEYFIPFKNNGDGEPVLYYFECDYGKVAYPFMLRDISKSKKMLGMLEQGTYFDISSAYGYGGPLYENCNISDSIFNLQQMFFKNFSSYCNKSNIISEFDRFHPLIKNHLFFNGYCEVLPISRTVYIDVRNKEKMWTNVESKCRNTIRKAEKNEVYIVLEDSTKTLEEFKDIYNSTMDRNDASQYYYFNNSFFDDSIKNLENNIIIANAYYKDNIIASSLIMKYDKYLHYHFSGAIKEYRNLQANNLLLYEVAKWGNENGYEKFHLGGGYESENDSLYKFKKSFSKVEDNEFYIGKKIHNIELYNKLTTMVNEEGSDEGSFFPKYRR